MAEDGALPRTMAVAQGFQFLHDKIPPWPKMCDFKWIGFWMTDAEIDEVVTKTTLHYGMQRMGYSPWYTVPCWS